MNIIAYALHIVRQSSPAHRSCGGWTRKRSIHRNHSLVPATTTLQEIEVNQTDKQECQINRRCAEHATIVLTFGCLNCSFFGSPGAFLVNFFQTLPDKENNYLIYQEMNKVADMVDNDRLNLLLEHLSHVRIVLGIFSSRV